MLRLNNVELIKTIKKYNTFFKEDTYHLGIIYLINNLCI